jgi:uncharacterized tellurite resistance protein B-like protein
MIKAIQRFYNDVLNPREPDGVTSQEATDHALRLATAALLVEVTRADREVTDEEREVVTGAIRETFGLSEAQTAELVGLADEEAREATSLFQFTYLIDKGFSHTQKRHVVALLWRVVFADARMEKHEEALVRRVADLIHVPHKDFIDTKIEARDAAKGSGNDSGDA